MTNPNHPYPLPQLGFYQAECCLECLYKIETPDDLAWCLVRVESADESGPLMVFPTLAEAIAALSKGENAAALERNYKRLGWKLPIYSTEPVPHPGMLLNALQWDRSKASKAVHAYRLGEVPLTRGIAGELATLTRIDAEKWLAMQTEHDDWLTYTGRSPDFGRRQ